MDYARYEGQQLTINSFLSQHTDIGKDKALEKLKRFGEKGVLLCPFCNEKMILRAGDKREVHFAHLKGRTCLIANSYDNYIQQTQRESKKHSIIRNIIYDELKTQEKIKKELQVEYGYIAKAEKKWKHVPDICVQTGGGKEIAVNIITNVHDIGDRKVAKQFVTRDRFFREHGMDVIWFVEDRELADDMQNRVLHLWEVEYNLAIKTEEDEVWDAFLYSLETEDQERIYQVMGYRAKETLKIDVKSLYYVHSLENEIQFSVHRIILDEKSSPYRSFAVNTGYRMSLSSALNVMNTLSLGVHEKDEQDREAYKKEYERRKEELNKVIYIGDELNLNDNSYQEDISHVMDMPPDDIDPVGLIMKLRSANISAEESYQLYYFLKKYRSLLPDYGLDLRTIKNLVNYSLGRISDSKIRTILIDIEELIKR